MNNAVLTSQLVPGWRNRKGPIQCGVPFLCPMSIALTATLNENITGQTTPNYNNPIIIHSGVTDLVSARVLFSLPGTLPTLWSQSAVPVATLFGKVDSARPLMHYPYPIPLPLGRFISAAVLNVQGEEAGTFVFVASQPSAGVSEIDAQRLGPMRVIPIDSQFSNTASEQKNSGGVLNPVDYDFLLLGFYTDLVFAQIQIIDCEGRQWMSGSTAAGATNACPVWGIAGRNNDSVWMRYLPLPYVIPAHQMPQVNFTNGSTAATTEASGQLYMFGQQLL